MPSATSHRALGPSAIDLPALPSDPLELARRWPTDRGLIMLLSGRHHERWARWTVLAEAPATVGGWLRIEDDEPDPLARLRAAGVGTGSGSGAGNGTGSGAGNGTGDVAGDGIGNGAGAWIGAFSYELGRAIEPASRRREDAVRTGPDGRRWPLIELARCDAMLVHDGVTGQWHARGDDTSIGRLVGALADAPRDDAFRLGAPQEIVDPTSWMDAVAETVELIRAGDLFQANLSRPLRVRIDGSVRAAALALLRRAQPWHGALIEMPDGRSIVSLSPELFLEGGLPHGGDGGQMLTRPIKGTRPAGVDPGELLASPKDLAELVMIVDLMRNDLGRVCTLGSVRVSDPRVIESHPTVHHGVATIEGRLRPGVDLAELLAATFPPGSVTGAPKIRAMQVIETLEPFARGPYCGAIGLIGDDGSVRLNVAIRTLAVAPDPAEPGAHLGIYGIGCGIVADSDPADELRESLDKASVIGAIPAR